ncbi:hypothetical protein ATEIFO6365_0012005600 [Aspergillus terreus]|uniref:Uncharacterized protein n=1 Tax=Aspergillus terreus TaxID=33178 RepID=A0A5M3ZDW0_ASPTE|nr:hypothetical protein ATETN484_0013006600 [Aspergillus terreus]GFF20300.1 hypothetical protein ATEIFO6365_0012005600 [Aspergillus terreus]
MLNVSSRPNITLPSLVAAARESPQESFAWADQVTLLSLRTQLVNSLRALDDPDSLAQSQPSFSVQGPTH